MIDPLSFIAVLLEEVTTTTTTTTKTIIIIIIIIIIITKAMYTMLALTRHRYKTYQYGETI